MSTTQLHLAFLSLPRKVTRAPNASSIAAPASTITSSDFLLAISKSLQRTCCAAGEWSCSPFYSLSHDWPLSCYV